MVTDVPNRLVPPDDESETSNPSSAVVISGNPMSLSLDENLRDKTDSSATPIPSHKNFTGPPDKMLPPDDETETSNPSSAVVISSNPMSPSLDENLRDKTDSSATQIPSHKKCTGFPDKLLPPDDETEISNPYSAVVISRNSMSPSLDESLSDKTDSSATPIPSHKKCTGPPDKLLPPDDETESSNPSSPVVISSNSVSPSPDESLRDKTVGEAILMSGRLQQVQDIVSLSDKELAVLEYRIEMGDEIALAIGSFPLQHRQSNGDYAAYARRFRLGMDLHLDLAGLMTLLDEKWLSGTAIDGILGELAVLSPGVQLISSHRAYEYCCKMERKIQVESSDIVRLQPDTHTLIIPFNLSTVHWCVAKATCHDGKRLLTVYNSSPGLDADLIEYWVPEVLDCIISDNSVGRWSNSRWTRKKVVQGQSLKQSDDYNCGVYTILNTLALGQQQEPSLQPVDPRALRSKYARAFVRALQTPLEDEVEFFSERRCGAVLDQVTEQERCSRSASPQSS